MKTMTRWQRCNLILLILACIAYLGLSFTAPPSSTPSPYHFSPILIIALGLTIVGLLLFSWVAGFYAWLQLDRYSASLPLGPGRKAFGFMAQGVWFLAVSIIVSSLLGATNAFYRNDIELTAVMTQINYYVIVLFPFLGFMKLRVGSRYLAVSAQAAMTVRAKLITVGPPVMLLAAFYIFLAATNSAPSAQALATGPFGLLITWGTVGLTIGSWILGLLAALNMERATYRGEGARHTRPLVGMYNGILATTAGFIIIDALLSLGTPRLQALPVAALLLLLYGFIGVIALGFWVMARSVRRLRAATPRTGGE